MRLLRLFQFAFLAFTLSTFAPAQTPEISLRHIQFHEVDTLFQNPGQGWFIEYYREPRFPDSVVYLRFDWRQAEPKDGKFDWTLIDKTIAKARSHGATVAIRIMTANAHSNTPYSSPQWLFKAGCKSYAYKNDGSDAAQGGRPMKRFEPDYADPIYLAKHAAFLQALGQRYNGDPNIEFLDIGSYGIWGEWHTTHPASIQVRQQIVDMYLNAFTKTPLVYMSDDAEVMSYALAHGTGLRRDGVGSPWHEARWAGTSAYANVPAMGDAWLHAPIVFEWFQTYDYLLAHKWSFDFAVDFMLRNHVSLINDNLGAVPDEIKPELEKLARIAGYRFVLRDLALPESVHPGDTLPITMQWSNVGVAKLYRPYTLSLQLRNAAGEVVASAPAPTDPRDWLPGDYTVPASISIPADLAAGAYTVTLGLFDTAAQRQPLHLAIDAPEKSGWYTVAQVSIAK